MKYWYRRLPKIIRFIWECIIVASFKWVVFVALCSLAMNFGWQAVLVAGCALGLLYMILEAIIQLWKDFE